jgi:hypothetical protein
MTIDSNAANAEPMVAKSAEPACKSLPPVDLLSDVRERPAPSPYDVGRKWWLWSGVTHIGDCSMRDELLTIRADGTANFFAHVKSSDDDDQWVFYGGISLLDVHGVVLWTSPKLIGPPMKLEDEWATWDENFNFPVVWFDSAAGARINQAHC